MVVPLETPIRPPCVQSPALLEVSVTVERQLTIVLPSIASPTIPPAKLPPVLISPSVCKFLMVAPERRANGAA